jgi:hypothetical protein
MASKLSLEERMKIWFPDEKSREVVEKVTKNARAINDGYGTCFALLDHKKKEIISRKNAACYAELPRLAIKKGTKEKLRYVTAKQTPKTVSEKTCIRWLQLCLDNKAIGDTHQSAEEIFHKGLVIDLFNPYWTTCRLYISLCNYRFIRECGRLVENVVALCDGANIPFWNAFVYCQGIVGTAGHSWLAWGAGGYHSGAGAASMRNNLWFARWINEYMSGKIEAKRPHFYSEVKKGVNPGWATAAKMVADNSVPVPRADRIKMISRFGIDAVKAKTVVEAKKIFNDETVAVAKVAVDKKLVDKIVACGAECKNGKSCRNNPVAGRKRCRLHSGKRVAKSKVAAGADEWFN